MDIMVSTSEPHLTGREGNDSSRDCGWWDSVLLVSCLQVPMGSGPQMAFPPSVPDKSCFSLPDQVVSQPLVLGCPLELPGQPPTLEESRRGPPPCPALPEKSSV